MRPLARVANDGVLRSSCEALVGVCLYMEGLSNHDTKFSP